eukprot:scaffold8270_cov119-Skeletonema_marinoi.AAC.2
MRMRCWRPSQIGPLQVTYDVVVPALLEKTRWQLQLLLVTPYRDNSARCIGIGHPVGLVIRFRRGVGTAGRDRTKPHPPARPKPEPKDTTSK